MPSPGASPAPRLPLEDAYLELLADTLEQMDVPARSQFLQRYFQTTTQVAFAQVRHASNSSDGRFRSKRH